MHFSYTINPDEIFAFLGSRSLKSPEGSFEPLSGFFLEAATTTGMRPAVLPPTVGWSLITFQTEMSVRSNQSLHFVGSNADGYLSIFVSMDSERYELCSLRRGENFEFNFEGGLKSASVSYIGDAVVLKYQIHGVQRFSNILIGFTGRVPKSKIGLGEPAARPLDDLGVNRVYLDHSIVGTDGSGVPISFARTEHKKATTYKKHAHTNDNVRIICSGEYEFTIFDPETDAVIYKCRAVSGDTVQVPAGYPYVEEVIVPGIVINGRSKSSFDGDNYWPMLHYQQPSPFRLKGNGNFDLSLGLEE